MSVRCPQCNNKVLQKSDSGVTLRTKGPMTFDKSGTCFTKCYWCKTAIEVPIEIGGSEVRRAQRFVIGSRG